MAPVWTRTTVALGVSLIVVFATAARCPWSSWASSADNAIQRAPAAGDILRGSNDLGSLGTEVDDLLRTAPKSGADQKKIDALVSLKRGLDDIQRLRDAADKDQTVMENQARSAAGSVTAELTLQDKLVEAGRDILKDVICDVTFSAMTKAEKEDTEKPRPKFSDAGEPTVEAIIDYGARLLSSAFGRDALTGAQWTQWGKSVYTKAILKGDTNGDKILTNGEKFELPKWTGSREFVYYARFCLAPPRK